MGIRENTLHKNRTECMLNCVDILTGIVIMEMSLYKIAIVPYLAMQYGIALQYFI
ncbi:MAG: hypothetical protein MRJ65_05495 [Candidatus Brocadiaceae bacterium]|nr:hypothetical protein [Candidatus Brocadiaceae bacterium]